MRTKPKKYLGQNFLVDKNIQAKIIASCDLRPDDTVVEVGPGNGELTRLISPRVNRFYAVEIDKELAANLKEDLRDSENFKVINQDILEFDFSAVPKSFRRDIKVIGNIPYYITTPIIEHLLGYRRYVREVYLTVQKEVAERIAARPGTKDFGALSCFVQYYTTPQILFVIKKGSFFPVPKVDSCFISLKFKKRLSLDAGREVRFFQITRSAFNQRRKILKNSLSRLIDKDKLDRFFDKNGLNKLSRPEELTIENFINLAKI